MSDKDKMKRLQFDFSPEALKDLENLQVITSSKTKVEIIRKSLKLYDYLIHMANDGYKIELVKGKEKIILIPTLVL